MTASGAFVGVLFIAVLTQWLTERFFGPWVKGPLIRLASAAIALALACSIPIESLAMVGIDTNTWVDRVITGLIISGGSNVVHDLIIKRGRG